MHIRGSYCQWKYQLSATWVSRVLRTAWQLASSKVRALGHNESKCSRQKSQPFYNQILGVALHHFCVLFIKKHVSQSSLYSRARGYIRHRYEEVGICGALSEAAQHSS